MIPKGGHTMPDAPVGRFAPTPSGRLHLGNILCAMLAYLSVRSRGGRFLLRIEDVDVPRCPRRLAQQAIDDLTWLGFTWDDTPLYQSDRSEIYQEALDRLTADGHIYPCFCTRAQLMSLAAPNLGDTQVVYSRACAALTPEEAAERAKTRAPAMRLRVPDEDVTFTDGLFGWQQENLERDCGDFILRRSDGLYGYQLAVVVDDALTGVTEVVRGRDILSATPRQLYLQRLLGYPQPEYIHIPLLVDAEGRRLAKRDRDLDLSALSQRFTPEDILGMLAFSAGLLPEVQPVTLEQLIPLFNWANVKCDDLRLPHIDSAQ
ncbi:MAG: tRNA glutamyl-Q(34) synthetase GluQRS [Clostridia bacterium]|nr:tRNA glutamyl-Q(34) synthetase GluQRS [Clostridia bacterium]